MTAVEDSEVLGKGKPDVAVKHGDIELSQTDRSQVKLKSGDSLLTESHMAAAAVEECGEQIPTARPRSPQIRSLGSSPVLCEGNKSPSLSPSLPVKYPRSKKRSAAPPPPMPPRPVSPKPPSPRPVSPKPPSPRPEARSVTKPEPQTLVPPQRPAAPRSPVGTSSQVTNKSSDRSPAANSEQSSVTVEPERVRRKITPDVKFTFENDVFRPAKTTATVDTSTSEQLKPSRPAPPRPAAASVTKRKVSAEEPLPVNFIKQKLAVLDAELKKLERDGCNMEDRIRSSAVDDDDIMMNDWLDMVQKKNELVREESELIYRLRQQELEDRHSQVEYELRRLMAIPEDKKTEEQKSRESELLQQLLVTVHRRNNIVDSMEEDRKRYLAEDEQISQMKATQGSDRKKKAG